MSSSPEIRYTHSHSGQHLPFSGEIRSLQEPKVAAAIIDHTFYITQAGKPCSFGVHRGL